MITENRIAKILLKYDQDMWAKTWFETLVEELENALQEDTGGRPNWDVEDNNNERE